MILIKLCNHLNKFISDKDRTIQWAKDAESILDEIDLDDISSDLEKIIDRLQDNLCIYRPLGGDYLIDENEMKYICEWFINSLCNILHPN